MATLVIKDLTEDKALDERAMKVVSGGSGGSALARHRRLGGAALATPGSLEESRLVRGLYKTPLLPR